MSKPISWKAEKRAVADLKHYEKNPRKIIPSAMAKLKDRISKRCFHDVVKLDTDGIVLSGNMRIEALVQLGVKEVNVLVPDRKLTPAEREAIVLESNRNDGTWDDTILSTFDSEVMLEVGFDSVEVDTLKETDEDEEDTFDVDKEAAKIKKPTSKYGQVWKLGESRLMCGDSTLPADLATLMGGEKADMVFTDPPYNMNIEGKQGKILNDHMSEEKFIEFSIAFLSRMKESTKSGAPFYICSGYSSYVPFIYAMSEVGLDFANPIVWVKNSLGMGMNDYRHQHELVLKAKSSKRKAAQPILYGWNGGKHYFKDVHDEGDVWQINKHATNNMVHSTQKPLALINRAIKNSSKRGALVLDLFGGSGTTLIGAYKTGRRAYIMELDPRYVDTIRARWEALTGEQAEKI